MNKSRRLGGGRCASVGKRSIVRFLTGKRKNNCERLKRNFASPKKLTSTLPVGDLINLVSSIAAFASYTHTQQKKKGAQFDSV